MLVVPAYTAVMLFAPAGRDDVTKIPLPLPKVSVASTVVPSMKVTEPVGMVVDEVTVAVSFTDSPAFDGFTDDTTTVDVVAWFTTWLRGGDVLLMCPASPE
jgi:hypothetical protein